MNVKRYELDSKWDEVEREIELNKHIKHWRNRSNGNVVGYTLKQFGKYFAVIVVTDRSKDTARA